MNALRRGVLEQRLEDIKNSMEELEYDYHTKAKVDGEPLTESAYLGYKKDLEAMLKETEEELNK